VWKLVQMEDENTDYADLGPVNAPMNTLCCFIHDGANSHSFKRHVDRLNDYMWMNKEGMHMNGTNGVQVWDTAFLIQSVVAAGLAESPRWKAMLQKAASFLEDQQILEEVPDQKRCYRQSRKGAWPFSTKVQGYTVSDCTSEALKATLQLQNLHNYPVLISESRIHSAIDVLLTMQNPHSGGFASYEPQRGSEMLEWLNAAEVFGRIMVEYDYPECTTAVVTVLSLFQKFSDYRTKDIDRIKDSALQYIRRAMRPDGSWYGSWGICFTYAGMFALESLASVGETYQTSPQIRKACEFLISKQMHDGGWGEDYRSCEQKRYVQHETSQVVQTAWACIALMEARYPDREPIKRALGMVVGRQRGNGEWEQEAIEGVFNQSW
jgi:lanosterol synthase